MAPKVDTVSAILGVYQSVLEAVRKDAAKNTFNPIEDIEDFAQNL